MEYLREYQTFHNKDELNAAIKEHLSRHKYDLNDTDRDILLLISRHAVKYPGVAHLKTETIAQAVGKSKRTVQRVIRKLERLGIIERLTFFRKIKGGYGANVYRVISPVSRRANVVEPCEPTDEQAENQNETNNLLNSNKNYENNTYIKTFYDQFRELINHTLGNVEKSLIHRLYGVYKAHSTPLLRMNAFNREDVEMIGWQALKTAIMATKRKKIRNLAGYFNGVLDRMYERLYFEEMCKVV
ncbi:helix-turn-helix domain-containing protein [Aeribacillus composti]|uniref:helix-turn-helix domain-containing protein n=1 Tax=Aeribacillus composti TaxID=1868734 RepID=UPI002E20BF31|nr:helix-turn-helix domain-containing protein [Aeribacillus composti]